jgi:hypothetical protein
MSLTAIIRTLVFLAAVLCTVPSAGAATMTPSDRETNEKLGLSEAEWGMVLDAHMPMSKVNFLLKSCISISEYFKSPWKELGMSESEWIGNRKSGLSDNDMRALRRPAPKESAPYIGAFFLPGCFQLARGQTAKGWIMAGAAVGMVALCAGHSAATKRFQPLGLFLLVPDMIWSGLDIGIQVNREQNPDASRFSGVFPGPASGKGTVLSLQVTIH